MGVFEVFTLIESISENRSLQNLLFYKDELCVLGAVLLSKALKCNTTVKTIEIHNNGGNIGTKALACVLNTICLLESVIIYDKRLGYLGIKALATALKDNTTIKTITISESAFRFLSAQELAKALEQNNSLTELSLLYCNICNISLGEIAKGLRMNSTLTTLNISGNKIGAIGLVSLIEALKHNTTLKKLILNNNYFGWMGAKVIGDYLSKYKNNIEILDINSCNIGDKGAESISEVLKTNTTLEKLRVDNNNISKICLRMLLEVLKLNRTLKHFYASCCNDDSIKIFTPVINVLKYNHILEELFLPNVKFNDSQLLKIVNTLESKKSIKELYYTPKNTNSIYICKISYILLTNSIHSVLRQNKFVLSKLPEELWLIICAYLPYEDLVNFDSFLRLE